MRDTSAQSCQLPRGPGVGYKPQHFDALSEDPGPVTWLEIHAENYMGDGGRPLAQLRALSEQFPVSVHGVGLSIGGEEPPDTEHLDRLKHLLGWLNPASFSEHLAWSTHDIEYLNDLLPLPYTNASLVRIADHIDQVQDALGRRMLLENPSSYLSFAQSSWSETEFLGELVKRTGCGLLLDVNNVFVSSSNLGYGSHKYIDNFPLAAVGEIHVGGHEHDTETPLLTDTHAKPVDDAVWKLLSYTLARTGPLPVLVEWDNDVPDWPALRAEADRVASALQPVL